MTEIPGSAATREQHARLYHRYHTAARFTVGKHVLEVACGAGLGLSRIACRASRVIGGDYTESLLRTAHSTYNGRIPLVRFDAHCLPFREQSFEAVILFEAIYYFKRADEVIREIRRVLTKEGLVLICSVNKDWSEFAPSLLSTSYFSVPELRDLLVREGFRDLSFFGGFHAEAHSHLQKVVSQLRRIAANLDLIPKTLTARAYLKRIFYGRLTPLRAEVDDEQIEIPPLVSISPDLPNRDYKIIYVAAYV